VTRHAPGGTRRQRVCLLGATGTIGRATAIALMRRGHDVVCFVRARSGVGGSLTPPDMAKCTPSEPMRQNWGFS
jgi:divinyl chlorophyllide a 8-vinyl-reductase